MTVTPNTMEAEEDHKPRYNVFSKVSLSLPADLQLSDCSLSSFLILQELATSLDLCYDLECSSNTFCNHSFLMLVTFDFAGV